MVTLLETAMQKKYVKTIKILDIFLEPLYVYSEIPINKTHLSFFATNNYRDTQKNHRLLFTKITILGENCVPVHCKTNGHRTGSNFTGKHASGNVRGSFIQNLKG